MGATISNAIVTTQNTFWRNYYFYIAPFLPTTPRNNRNWSVSTLWTTPACWITTLFAKIMAFFSNTPHHRVPTSSHHSTFRITSIEFGTLVSRLWEGVKHFTLITAPHFLKTAIHVLYDITFASSTMAFAIIPCIVIWYVFLDMFQMGEKNTPIHNHINNLLPQDSINRSATAHTTMRSSFANSSRPGILVDGRAMV